MSEFHDCGTVISRLFTRGTVTILLNVSFKVSVRLTTQERERERERKKEVKE